MVRFFTTATKGTMIAAVLLGLAAGAGAAEFAEPAPATPAPPEATAPAGEGVFDCIHIWPPQIHPHECL